MHMQYKPNILLPRLHSCFDTFEKHTSSFFSITEEAEQAAESYVSRPSWTRFLFPFSSAKKQVETFRLHKLGATLATRSMQQKIRAMIRMCEEAIEMESLVYVSTDDLDFIDGIEKLSKVFKEGTIKLEEAMEE